MNYSDAVNQADNIERDNDNEEYNASNKSTANAGKKKKIPYNSLQKQLRETKALLQKERAKVKALQKRVNELEAERTPASSAAVPEDAFDFDDEDVDEFTLSGPLVGVGGVEDEEEKQDNNSSESQQQMPIVKREEF